MDNAIHVYPLNDLWEHITEGTECPCDPEIKSENNVPIIVHNSFDHREIVEQAIDIMNEEDESDG